MLFAAVLDLSNETFEVFAVRLLEREEVGEQLNVKLPLKRGFEAKQLLD